MRESLRGWVKSADDILATDESIRGTSITFCATRENFCRQQRSVFIGGLGDSRLVIGDAVGRVVRSPQRSSAVWFRPPAGLGSSEAYLLERIAASTSAILADARALLELAMWRGLISCERRKTRSASCNKSLRW